MNKYNELVGAAVIATIIGCAAALLLTYIKWVL